MKFIYSALISTMFYIFTHPVFAQNQTTSGSNTIYSTGNEKYELIGVSDIDVENITGTVEIYYRQNQLKITGSISGLEPNIQSKLSVFSLYSCSEESNQDWWNTLRIQDNPWLNNYQTDNQGNTNLEIYMNSDQIGYDVIEILNHPLFLYDSYKDIVSCSYINSLGVLSNVLFSDGYLNYYANQNYFQITGFLENKLNSNLTLFDSESCNNLNYKLYSTLIDFQNTSSVSNIYIKEYSEEITFNPLSFYNSLVLVTNDKDSLEQCDMFNIFIEEWSIQLRNNQIEVVFSDETEEEEIKLFYEKTPYRNHTVEIFHRNCEDLLENEVISIYSQNSNILGELDINLNLETANINNNEEIYFENENSLPTIEFCVRVNLILDSDPSTVVSFLETVVIINLDLSLNFNLAEGFIYERNDPAIITQNAIIDYSIDACLCETPIVSVGDTCDSIPEISGPFSSGTILGICLNTDSSDVIINRIVELILTQDGQEKGGQPIENGVFNELTNLVTSNGLSGSGRNIAINTRLVDDFFEDQEPEDILARGVVEIEFANRRQLQKIEIKRRGLQNTSIQKNFEIIIDLDGGIDIYISDSNSIDVDIHFLSLLFLDFVINF